MSIQIDALTCDEREFTQNQEKWRIYREDSLDKMYTMLHSHGFVELFILLSGSVTYVFEHGSYDLRDFDIIVVPPHALHQLVITKKNVKYRRMALWISLPYLKSLSSQKTDLFEGFQNSFSLNQYVLRNPEFTFKIKPYIEKIIRLQTENPYGADILIENTLREIFVELNVAMNEEGRDKAEMKGDPLVLGVSEYIEDHLSEDLSLEAIAKNLNYNEYYLSHTFSDVTGTTIHKYITKKRLSQSRKYIDEGYNNKELISLIGYKDESHFTQAFKKEYGYTPRQYKARAHMK